MVMADEPDVEVKEYFTLLETVANADQRLLTIKGWGVTLSLAALGLGFQYRAYGYFLVAAVSSAAFWLLEATVKRHQMRYYPRMRQIEVERHQAAIAAGRDKSAPLADWSWDSAGALLTRGTPQSVPVLRTRTASYGWIWIYPHVSLPHALTLIAALALLALGVLGLLPSFSLGAPPK
jgi:hypothetical protein